MEAGVKTLALMTVIVGTSVCETNIALGKPTNQSSLHAGLTSDRAVDGYKYGERPGETHHHFACTHTQRSSQNGWWYVDLEIEYRVKDVTVYTRTDCCVIERQRYVRLSVGPSLSDLTLCTEGDYYAGNQTEYTISCDRLGRFVHIEAWGDAGDRGMFTLCEVVVTAGIDCSECPSGVPCNNVTGGCSQCAAGRLPPDCTQDCKLGSYGLNCTNPCGSCASGAKNCTTESGVCTQGCELWWATDKCNQQIVKPSRMFEKTTITKVAKSSIALKFDFIKITQSELFKYYFYKIQYKTGPSDYVVGPSVNHSSGDTITADVTGLEPYTSYDFLVTPWRRMSGREEAGTPYPVITARTECGAPDAPVGVTASVASYGGFGVILVGWEDMSNLNARCASLVGAFVEIRHQTGSDWTVYVADVTQTQYTITPPGGGVYDVRVTVVNSNNSASSSDVITIMIEGKPIAITTVMQEEICTNEDSNNPQSDGPGLVAFIATAVTLGVLLAAVVPVTVYLAIYYRNANRQNTKSQEQSGVPMTKLPDAGHVTYTNQYEHVIHGDVSPSVPDVYDTIRQEQAGESTSESPYEQV